MSLFPAAGAATASAENTNKKQLKDRQDWLKNTSYHLSRASELVNLQKKTHKFDHSSNTDSSEDEMQLQRERNRKKRQKLPHIEISKSVTKESSENDDLIMKQGKMSVIVDHLESDMPKFRSDKNADMDNVHFGRLYKVLTPKYYRDLTCCVGTPKWQYLKIKEPRKKKRKRRNDDSRNRYYNNKLPIDAVAFSVMQKGEKLLTASSFTENYIVVSNKDSIDETIEITDPNSSEKFKKNITEQLNRRTRENPQDIEAWMRLLSWQDEVMKDTLVHGRSHVLSEKKIEILNHAVKVNPRDFKLRLIRIRLESEITADTATLDTEWQNLLFRFPNNIEVWRGYISHINCNSATSFSLKRTRRAFGHCIEILRSIKDGMYKQDVSSDVSAEDRLVEVFTEYADFLSAVGHTEQWVSLYQCVLELNFRGPLVKTTWAELMDYLGQYFSNKEPMLGEKGSKGLNAWITKHETGGWTMQVGDESAEAENCEEEEDIDPELSLVQNWLKIEQSRCDKDWMPWRPSFDGDECDDVERKVWFSNLKDLMLIVNNNTLKIKLLKSLLRLVGSPQQYNTTSTEPFSMQNIFFFSHSDQVFKQNELLLGIKPLLFNSGHGCNSGVLDRSKHTFVCEIFSQLISGTTDRELKEMLCCEYMLYHEHRVISLFADGKPSELRKSGKEARKIAKQLLSTDPDLLRIWCNLGVVEWLCGKRPEACKIFQTTLSMSTKSMQTMDRSQKTKLLSDIHFICMTFAMLHFNTCESCCLLPQENAGICSVKLTVLQTLAALGDNYKFFEYFSKNDSQLRPINMMKASSGFARLVEELQSLYEQREFEKDAANCIDKFSSSYLHIIFCEYIFSVSSVSPHIYNGFENAVQFLRKNQAKGSMQAKIDLEHLYHFNLYVLRVSALQCRSIQRKVIYDAANEFPCSPYFAKILGEIDMSSYLCGNVRRHFAKICSENTDSVIPWLCATRFELSRRKKILNATSVTETLESGTLLDARIRNLFERALAVGSNMGSLVLWRAYLSAEAEIDPSRVHAVYTRAVNSCSWSRELHLDILTVKPDLLVDVVSHMSKKGLRLRTPVEEVQLLMTI